MTNVLPQDCTPVRNEVFTEHFRDLRQRRSAALYLFLYDLAYYAPNQTVAMTPAELSRLSGIDQRTVKKSLSELQQQGLIVKARKGVKHSKSPEKKPAWEVPLAKLKVGGGNWTPIPREIIRRYFSAYPNSVLAALLIYYQNKGKRNDCWPGIPRLAKELNWSETRVRDSLKYLCSEKDWRSLHRNLPWLVECNSIQNEDGKTISHFTVRAIEYKGTGKQPVMRLTASFRRAFDLL